MIIDLHVHTRNYSGCSNINAWDLIEQARHVGLDGLVLAEHGILWREEKLAPLRDEAANHDLVILAGQEVTCVDAGRRQDFLVFGMNESMGTSPSPQELIERVHDQGGVVVAAHPFKPSRLGTGYHGAGDDIYDLEIDAVELYHPDHNQAAREKVRAAADALGIPVTGGSDAHEIYDLGANATRFQVRLNTIEDLIAEIRAGRVEPLNGAGRV